MKEQDKIRLEMEQMVIQHQTSHYDICGDQVYYPVNHQQLRDLLGKLLTQLDAMGLPERVHLANKALLIQTAWRWWDDVYSNSTTSSQGCIAPIVCAVEQSTSDSKDYPSNRWGYETEEQYLNEVQPVKGGSDE